MLKLPSGGSSTGSSPPSSPTTMDKAPVSILVSSNPGGKANERKLSSTKLMKGQNKEISREILSSVNQFHRKQEKGTLDVWWLFDDGGDISFFFFFQMLQICYE